MKELNVVLSNLKPLQALLSTIMNDSHYSVSKMPFSSRYDDGQFSLFGSSGILTQNSELNTYFDSSAFAMSEVADDCLHLISYFDSPDDELYTYLKSSLKDTVVYSPEFYSRDETFDEKTYGGFYYVSSQLNFALFQKDIKRDDVNNFINISNVFKCFSLLMDSERPFMKTVPNDDQIRSQCLLITSEKAITDIISTFISIVELELLNKGY